MAAVYKAGEDLSPEIFAGASCAFGAFDGVHAGHRFIIGRAQDAARAEGSRCVVITFDTDPDELFAPSSFRKLMSDEARLAALSSLDVDAVAVLSFDRELAAQEPLAFLDRLFGAHAPRSLHVGRDFRFGSHAAGSVEELMQWGEPRGMQVDAVDLLELDGAPVTSTRIRSLLADGDVAEAERLLGRFYAVSGTVLKGRGEGREMGFSTANLVVPEQLHVLREGVYAGYALVDGVRYKAAISCGVSPTFADRAKANLEVHILDFEGDLYGKEVEVAFVAWLRPMIEFPSVDELIKTVTANIQWVRDNLS